MRSLPPDSSGSAVTKDDAHSDFQKKFDEEEKAKSIREWGWMRLNGCSYFVWRDGIVVKALWFFIAWVVISILTDPSDTELGILCLAGIVPCIWLGWRSALRAWTAREKEYMEAYPDAAPVTGISRRGIPWDPAYPWLRRRYLANVADSLVALVPAMLLAVTPAFFSVLNGITTILFDASRSTHVSSGKSGVAIIFFILLLVIPASIHNSLFISLCGRTPAMWIFGLSIARQDGRRLTVGQSFLRYWRLAGPSWLDKGRYNESGTIQTSTAEWDRKQGYIVTCSLHIHWFTYLAAIGIGISALIMGLDCTDGYSNQLRFVQILNNEKSARDSFDQAMQVHTVDNDSERVNEILRHKPWGKNAGDPAPWAFFTLLTGYLALIACTLFLRPRSASSRNIPLEHEPSLEQ